MELKNCKIFRNDFYSNKMLQNLNNLWQAECFCDVEIACDGQVFQVHRLILASASSYFRAMFTGTMKEARTEKIELKDISATIFSSILNFIYTGQVALCQSTVQEVLAAADMLGLPEVMDSCTEFLKTELHYSNALGIYRFAEAHSCETLKTHALSYIHRHFPQIAEEDEFLDIPKDLMLQFLESEELKVNTEFQVLQAALKWLMNDIKDRKPYVFEVLKPIRLALIPGRLLEQVEIQQTDLSIKVALRGLQRDLQCKRGSLVNLLTNPRKAAKKYMYVIGGSHKQLGTGWKQLSESTLSNVLCLDTFKKSWSNVASMDIERILPGVAALDGLIYVVGGEQESKILANGEVYSPQEDTWSAIAPMMIPRCSFGLAAWENYLFAFGGWVGEDIGGSIEIYNPYLNEWTMSEFTMEEPRFSMSVFTHNSLIYMLGGCTHSHRHSREFSSFNPVTGEWTKLAPMKVSRSQMGFAVLDKHLYCIGGSSKHAEVLRSVERYSFDEDRWVDVAPMKIGRCNPAVGAADGMIYVAGGDQSHESNFFRAQITISHVECYDPYTDSWQTLEDLPESRSEAGVVVM